MARLPIAEAARRWGMAEFLVRNLQSNGHEHFFPIQALTIPDAIIAERHMTSLRIRDVCCAAPTGSGKTLAFVLPVLNALASRRVRRLRALVILPSRDLAQQVYGVFDAYRKGSRNDLRIGLAIGQTEFRAEQKKLILGDDADSGADNKRKIPAGGISAVDVLVCTPGRLVDHLDNTPGFTLQHLRWLVIDEADRLLSQSYHGWIQRVLDCVHAPPTQSMDSKDNSTDKIYSDGTSSESPSDICQRVQLRKLLYSATLTKDPQKLSSLRLINPKYFNAHDLKRRSSTGVNDSRDIGNMNGNNLENSLYRMPEQLKECTVECTAEQKPIVLLALLLERLKEYEESSISSPNRKKKKNIIVVFTSSLEATHRLTRLLQLLFAAGNYGTPPVEFSSNLNQNQRSMLMKRCNDENDRSVSVLICSDGMSRGMDLASVVAVIHYDVPGMAKTYVHRCGRTARAGQDGTAIAILKGKGQAGQFAKLRRLIALPERVTKTSVKTSLVRCVIPLYRQCVSCLKEVLAAEDRNELKSTSPDLTQWLPSSVRDRQPQQNSEDDLSSDSDSSSDISSATSMSLSSTT
ncbi:DEAD-domain-containing protein [Fragilariopsis cylindrus CCMP1102]|uniref:ATP-dependent RNA helicase n=1 Tax=Fragilariopsis cylindrus CCMP1102 TaxID=635003 RepID=A0A1E7FSJ3_9STRA|nr:DEAD-domain-containing protein [Fragilariopsis cylindrus CCMP1102]|eukprot:OEU21077.1 DEAD-domain-containing protein [Fragilariopsis cylindrus CCMP1102]